MARSADTKKQRGNKGSSKSSVVVFVATRKGLWRFKSDRSRRKWETDGPHFLGQIIHHAVADPRNPKHVLAATSTGHLGPALFRSTNGGRKWHEVRRTPAFAKASGDEPGRVVNHVFWLTPGHASEPGVWYAGTSPHGLFRSADDGDTWESVSGLNDNPQYREWMGGPQDGTPDGPKLHSINVHPDNPQHLYIAMSSGGVHESLDGGATWQPLIDGLEVVEGFDASQVWFHDPHCVRISPADPNRLYQQNHCGIYRLDRPGTQWQRIGRKMPKRVGDIGFPLVVHPRDADTAWVFPMDGSNVWPRVSINGKPAAYVTRNGGKTWKRQDGGMPEEQAWWTVKRQSMTNDMLDPVGLYFGTTSGELWMSRNEGEKWQCMARHLPEIYAVEAMEV